MAVIPFEKGKKYRFESAKYNTGALVIGALHGSTALLYYDVTATNSVSDAWWYIDTSSEGYTIKNATTQQYIYYDPKREETVAKGLRLTADLVPEAVWTFHDQEGYFFIQNSKESTQRFNLRLDGSYLMGAYESTSTSSINELFTIYDENGNTIKDDGNTGSNTSDKPTSTNRQGINSNGEYWELTGLANPVVITTEREKPVLYTIQNVRKGNYVYATASNLYQSADITNATQFYFVQANNGAVNLMTNNGEVVQTWENFSSINNSKVQISQGEPDPKQNLWKISFYNDLQYPGYALERQSNRNETKNHMNDDAGHSICYWNLDGGSTFCFASADARHLHHLQSQGIHFDGTMPGLEFHSFVDSIRFDNKDLVYRKDTKTYMFNVRPKYRDGQTYTPKIQVKFTDFASESTLYIDGKPLSANNTFDFSDIDGSVAHKLEVKKNGETLATTDLHFTFLPIIEINMPSCNANYYTTGSIRVNYFQDAGYDSTFIAAFKYRGATAGNFSKKAFAIKLRDAYGNNIDREFLGFRNDNNWILDAMVIDPASMRNRVSTDLWNDFSSAPYHKAQEPKARTGTRGKFVEVLLNGVYHGLYCMTEKMDRKQLRLKKSEEKQPGTTSDIIHGTLYKASQWSYEVFFGHEIEDISYNFPSPPGNVFNNSLRQETQNGFEIKYPDYEEQNIDWKPLENAINFVATSDDYNFAQYFDNYFDRPALVDYYLLIELLLATDNHGKNMFYFNYDQKASLAAKRLGIAVWDLDGTWGIRWDGKTNATNYGRYTQLLPTLHFPTFLDQYEHGQLSYYYRLANNDYMDWHNELKTRYAQLRSTYFNPDSLAERFDYYAELFRKSNADKREASKWNQYHKNIQNGINYATDWLRKRIAYLDTQYEYDPTAGIHDAPTISRTFLGATGGKGCISYQTTQPQILRIYTIGGQLIRQIQTGKGIASEKGFMPGIYIVKGIKVIVK